MKKSPNLTKSEIKMIKRGICPHCKKIGIDNRFEDNQGHGGYLQCPSCKTFFFPTGKLYGFSGNIQKDRVKGGFYSVHY